MSQHPPSLYLSSIFVALALLFLLIGTSSAQLDENFYCKKCPNVFDTVETVVKSAVSKEQRIGASLLRLFFHDCFVDLGGPFWNVKVGRRDSRTANFIAANTGVLPSPASNLTKLISTFKAQGLSVKDMVALSGAHTIGEARCTSFRNHIYNENNIDSTFAKIRQRKCPSTVGTGDNNLANLDLQTPTHFDNNYYKNLIIKKGLLHSDQELFNGGSTDSLVQTYTQNEKAFDSDFVAAMIKMGNNKPLTGGQGEIRKNCRRLN
ncbi:peroxidase 4-like isoform X2 [Cicer arietinum]|uniref:peroxidase n=1 Tax=Cicer arietinum TaxID=3827 RepID=A0A3Q7YFD0_CICAR|nr:peroxidase 4-like isoform X2 [Cicer arietinum]